MSREENLKALREVGLTEEQASAVVETTDAAVKWHLEQVNSDD